MSLYTPPVTGGQLQEVFMNKLLAYSITAIISLLSFPHFAHADRDGWNGHYRHGYERGYGHYRPYSRDSVVVIGQAYPDYYYAAPTYYAVPSYSYVPVAPAPVAAAPQPV
jgi:hypothetical protein